MTPPSFPHSSSQHPWPRALALLLVGASSAWAQIPSFPGAEGAGGYARGGRGGDVYHVTNTNASGPGSFAEGCTTIPAAGRTIVFDVSGYAHVNGLRITGSKLTIAGQTAPGDGFGVKDGVFRVSGDDIVIRHMRFRYGDQTAGGDAVDLDSGSLNSIFDHCTVEFSTDENFSSFGSPPENMTFQWSINAWGLESHSCGGLWDQNHATSHHSLWAHNHTRNPKARPSLLDWVNNVTFDWDIGFILADSTTPANWNANVIGNYFISCTSKTKALEKGSRDRNGNWNFHTYLNNNLLDGNVNHVLDGTDTGYGMLSGDVEHLAAPLVNTGVPVTIDDPLTAYKKIVSSVGPLRQTHDPSKPIRDEVDTILINDLITQTRRHITHENQTGAPNNGMGNLVSLPAPTDTDRDGMPDFWEQSLAWNVAVDDHNTVFASSGGLITGSTFFPSNTVAGYTRLEEYLHWLAIPHGTVPRNTTLAPTFLDVDLRKFTSGFSSNPVFTLSNVTGGATSQSGTGGYLVRFTPTLNAFGRAWFDFKVQDAAGSQWTQRFGILVSSAALPKNLAWKGDGGTNDWDTTSNNFLIDTTLTAFGPGDSVTFNDTGSKTPATRIQTTVAPGGVTVNSTGNYTMSGTGGITSTGTLTKSGTGSLTLSNTGGNNFTKIVLNDGTLVMGNASALGSGPMELRGGALTMGGAISNALAVLGPVSITTGGNEITGAWTGDGQINANITGGNTCSVRGDITAFSGTLALGASTGFLRFYGSTGSSLAAFDAGTGSADFTNRNGNATIQLGSLAGGPNTRLAGASSVVAPTTYAIGANNASTTFAGTIADGQGVTNIVKEGTGELILSGTSNHTGTTQANAGTLTINGALGNSPLTVATGVQIRGAGNIGGVVTMQSGSRISPGAASGLVGTMTLGATGLHLQGATLSYQLSKLPTGVNDKITMTGGALNLSNVNQLVISYTDGVLGSGTYDLISGGASTVGNTSNVAATFPTGGRQTFALSTPPGKLQLTVTGDATNLLWVGNLNAATWDSNLTANFSGFTPGTFFNYDTVTFDDTSSNRTVTLTGNLAPLKTTVNTTAGYTWTGTGSVSGGSLIKEGTGTLSISQANTFADGTAINAGRISLTNTTANNGGLGTGAVTLNTGTLAMYDAGAGTHAGTLPNDVIINTTGTLRVAPRCGFSGDVFGGGTFTYYTPYVRADITGNWSAFTGQVNVITDADGGDFRISTNYAWPGLPAAAVNLADKTYFYFSGIVDDGSGTTISVGELSGTALSYLRGGVTGGRNFTYRIGSRNTNATFAGNIAEQNSGTSTQYVKTGIGNWTLSGTGSWNGSTTVEQGTLTISGTMACASTTDVQTGATLCLSGGSLTTDSVNVAEGATFCGSGTITGDLNNDGTLLANTGGSLNVIGDVVNNGVMRITSGTALNASGAFVNNGILDLLTSSSQLPANLENNGTIIDSGGMKLLSAGKTGNAFSLSIKTFTGHSYQLQRTSSTSLSGWQNIGSPLNGNDAVQVFSDPTGATLARRFYRIVVTP